MKLIAILFLLCSASFADEEQKPITISAPKSLATFNPKTQEWTLEKGAKPEDVMTALLRELQNVYARLAEMEKAAKPPEAKPVKKSSPH